MGIAAIAPRHPTRLLARFLARLLGRLARLALLLFALSWAAVIGWTMLWPMDRPPPQGDAIICLGAGVDALGRIDAASRSRAETCAALARQAAAPVIVFTGGPAQPGSPSAAAGMADAARAAGTGTARLLLEEQSQSTLQNARYALALLPEGARIILVSEAFHLPRAALSFRAMGAGDLATYPALRLRRAPDGGLAQGMLLREAAALWFNAARYGAWRIGGALAVPDATRDGWLR